MLIVILLCSVSQALVKKCGSTFVASLAFHTCAAMRMEVLPGGATPSLPMVVGIQQALSSMTECMTLVLAEV